MTFLSHVPANFQRLVSFSSTRIAPPAILIEHKRDFLAPGEDSICTGNIALWRLLFASTGNLWLLHGARKAKFEAIQFPSLGLLSKKVAGVETAIGTKDHCLRIR